MMRVYRISVCKYIEDLSGEGSYLYGGRWNSKGTRLLYTAENPALAMLEALGHLTMMSLQQDFCMAILDVPDDMRTLNVADMLPGWDNSQAPDMLKPYGDNFASANKTLALKVPSVLVPENYNILINPLHPLAQQVKLVAVRKVQFDQRLTSNRY